MTAQDGTGTPPWPDEAGHTIIETPVTVLASGQPLTLTTHVVRGDRPGPTVGIISGLHGDEFSTAEVVLSLLPLLPPAAVAGTLLLVPMASPLSFETGTRSTSLDMANLNRVFPGNPSGTVTEMLAHALTEQVIARCDAVLDLHSEPDTMSIRCLYSPAPTDDVGQRSLALAKASGCPIIYVTDALGGMLAGTARQRGIPVVMPETGGPLPGPDGLLAEAQGEILNILRALHMIPGEPVPPAHQVLVDTVAHLRAPVGGLYRPMSSFDRVGGSIPGDTVLGTIVSVFTGATLAEIRAPFPTSWLMMVRGRLSRVHPGDPLFIVGREIGHSA